jgi:hypothetical protein
MNKSILTGGMFAITLLVARAQNAQFLPGHLAVLRAGDGLVGLHLKQAPIFVDQFDTNGNNAAPSFTVAIPTNGPNAFFFNGHAATEGNLTRSSDHTVIAFAGYGGVNLLENSGTPSLLDIPRGYCTIDAMGMVHSVVFKGGMTDVKMNPRGIATDGSGNFWGCGNANGAFYYNPTATSEPVRFASLPNSRAIRIINNALYATINGADGTAIDKPAGIYDFRDASGASLPLPRTADVRTNLVVPVEAPYTKNAGFDMNSAGTIAYMSDTVGGVQKYVKSGGAWKFAYNFSIPQTIPTNLNNATGCFGLAVDFGGPAPIIYATTTEGYGGGINSNRVVRIIDTNATATVVTLARTGSVEMAFRGIDFTPEMPASGLTKP